MKKLLNIVWFSSWQICHPAVQGSWWFLLWHKVLLLLLLLLHRSLPCTHYSCVVWVIFLWLMMWRLYAKPVYNGNDIHSALFILSQRQTFALHQTAAVCSSPDAGKKTAYRTKISAVPKKHLAELKRAADNEQIPCFIYCFLTIHPREDRLGEWKAGIHPHFSPVRSLDAMSPACLPVNKNIPFDLKNAHPLPHPLPWLLDKPSGP